MNYFFGIDTSTEGAAFGAVLIAGIGTGAWADVPTACREIVRFTGQTLPDCEQVKIYSKMYPLYQECIPC
jgi:xylulokinase